MALFREPVKESQVVVACPECGAGEAIGTGIIQSPRQVERGGERFVRSEPIGQTFLCLRCWQPYCVTASEVFRPASNRPVPATRPVMELVKPASPPARPAGMEDMNLGR